MKLKRIITLILATVTLGAVMLGAVSCGNDELPEGLVIDCNNTKKSMSYMSPYTYEEFYDFEVEGTITIDVKVVTEAGGFGAAIYPKDLYKKGIDVETISVYFLTIEENDGVYQAVVTNGGKTETVTLEGDYTDTITLASDGEYVLRVKGAAHKGSFKFDW